MTETTGASSYGIYTVGKMEELKQQLENNKNYELVYRIWDKQEKDWYRSNSRSIWITLAGAKTTLGHAVKSKFNYEGRYQIKTFKLIEVN